MKQDLGISPRPAREAIIDACYSLIEKGFVDRKPGYRPREVEDSNAQAPTPPEQK